MIQPSSFLNNYSEEAFKDFRTRVLLDLGFFESEEGVKPTFAYNNSILSTPLDSDTIEFIKATGIKDNTITSYINNYVVKLKRFGLWSKMKALYPFVSDQRNLASYTESTADLNVGTNAVLSTTEVSPTGSLNAVRVNNAGGNPYNFKSFTLPQNTQYTFSVYVRAVSGVVNFGMYVNYSNGSSSLPISYFNATTTWQRFNITFNTSTFSNDWFTVLNFMSGNIEFWGWQLELGSVVTDYQPVLGSAASIYANHFKYNLKDPRNLDAAFRLVFNGGWTYSQQGATPNGTNAYADTKFNPAAELTISSSHFTKYNRTNDLVNYKIDGCYQGSSWFQHNYTTANALIGEISAIATYTATNTRGFFIASRTSSSAFKVFQNTTNVASNNATITTIPNLNVYIGTRNDNGTPNYYNTYECAFASIGYGLTDSEASTFYYITEELQANLNRNVNSYNQFRGVLDEYPGAAAAYSLRRLSGSYGGPLVRVRRSSDNAEQDIYPLANGSLDTTSLLSFVGANNGFVTTWYDQSGNLNNAVQSTAGNQPQIVSGSVLTQGSRPAIYFSMSTYLTPPMDSISGDSSFYFVTKHNSPSSSWGWIIGDKSGIIFIGKKSADSIPHLSFAGYNPGYDITGNIVQYAVSFWQQGLSNSQYKINGYSNTLVNGQNTNSYRIGGRINYNEFWIGPIQEIIHYPSQTDVNSSRIFSNINTYYNIYWDGSRKGLLDFYPSAAAAYSLRALSSSYRGPLVKVRRSSDNSEQDFYALQNGSLDTFGLAAFCSGTDGFVTTWYDQSGNGRNATQTTAANQPQIVSGGSVILDNSKPAVQFDGSNDRMGFTSITGVTGITLMAVLNYSTISNNLTIYEATEILTAYNIAFVRDVGLGGRVGKAQIYFEDGTSRVLQGSNISINTQYLQFGYVSSVGTGIAVNSNLTTGTSAVNNCFVSYIANDPTIGASYYFGGKTSEIIVYTSDQSSNRTGIESNINTYYAIY